MGNAQKVVILGTKTGSATCRLSWCLGTIILSQGTQFSKGTQGDLKKVWYHSYILNVIPNAVEIPERRQTLANQFNIESGFLTVSVLADLEDMVCHSGGRSKRAAGI